MRFLVTLYMCALASCAPMAKTSPADFQAGVVAYDAGDYARARAVWEASAARYDLAAMRNLGLLYEKGLGVARNHAIAEKYYKRAAESGLVSAQLNLARLYANKASPRFDATRAYHWYAIAAQHGNRLASFEAAKRLYTGDGVAADPKSAHRLMTNLARSGMDSARQWLENHR